MMTAKRWTAKSLLAAAKRKHGNDVMMRESKSAPTAAEREMLKAERSEWLTLRKEAEAFLSTVGLRQASDAMVAAAQFVVDVNGDNPSIPQLAVALEQLRKVTDALDTKREAIQACDRLSGKIFHYRFRLSKTSGMFNHVLAEGDTLDELATNAFL